MAFRIALFDMDGTLLDTLRDLAQAINTSLTSCGYTDANCTPQEAAQYFGSGARAAFMRVLAKRQGVDTAQLLQIKQSSQPDDLLIDMDAVEKLNREFERYYTRHSNDYSRPYPGIIDMLQTLTERQVQCAIVSNKIDSEVKRLAAHYFGDYVQAAFGLTSSVAPKPAPDLVHAALEALSSDGVLSSSDGTTSNPANQAISLDDIVYIGDTEIDLLCARNAGIACISVDWGFRSKDSLLQQRASCIVSNVQQLTDAILS